jgi:hypothetical protein
MHLQSEKPALTVLLEHQLELWQQQHQDRQLVTSAQVRLAAAVTAAAGAGAMT